MILCCKDLLAGGRFCGTWYEVETTLGIVKVKFDDKIDTDNTVLYFDATNVFDKDKKSQIIEDMINYAIKTNIEYSNYKDGRGIRRVYVDVLETKQ